MQRRRFNNEIKGKVPYFNYPIDNKTVKIGQELQIELAAVHPQDGPVYFGGQNIPDSAQYVDHGNGTATFRWTPERPGLYLVIFTVDDGENIYNELIHHQFVFIEARN